MPDYTKIRGIKISESGEVRLVEAWRTGTDGAVNGTREMQCVSATNVDGTKKVLDRVGGESGNYFSPMKSDGTPYGLKERAIGDYLPESEITKNDSYHQYEMQMDFTKENLEKAINSSSLTSAKKAKLLDNLDAFYMESKNLGFNGGDIYKGTSDGVKTGIIDNMFLKDDGGAIQYITPFSAEQMVDLGILKRLK